MLSHHFNEPSTLLFVCVLTNPQDFALLSSDRLLRPILQRRCDIPSRRLSPFKDGRELLDTKRDGQSTDCHTTAAVP
jgi:hypothetical protein